MNNDKAARELYQSVMNEVHAPDELVQRIKNADAKRTRRIHTKWIAATAACLAAVMMITVVIAAFNGKGDSFVFKASASEIGGEAFAEMAKVAPIGGESGGVVDGNHTTHTYNSIVPFALYCDGRNIRSIRYTIQNAVFLFPYDSYAADYREKYPNQAAASDKVTEKVESEHKIESYIEKDKQYASYTVSFDDQIKTELKHYSDMQTYPICILATLSTEDPMREETKAAIAHLYSGGSVTDPSFVDALMEDFRVIYDEMFSKVTVTADVTYQDGTTDSVSLRFSCLSADQKNGFIIGAKTA